MRDSPSAAWAWLEFPLSMYPPDEQGPAAEAAGGAPEAPSGEVTRLLVDWSGGDEDAAGALMPLVYEELRRRAAAYLSRERQDLTQQATALVHETYLRLIDQRRVHYRNRLHFFALAAKLMRRILVDHARGHLRAKRGGGVEKVVIDDEFDLCMEEPAHLVVLGEALDALEASSPELARVVELRFFGGFKNEEIAELAGISIPTITRRWRLAKTWLYRRLRDEA